MGQTQQVNVLYFCKMKNKFSKSMEKEYDIVVQFREWCESGAIRPYSSNLKGLQKMLCDYFNSPSHDIKQVWQVKASPSYDNDAKQFAMKALLGPAAFNFLEAVDALVKEHDMLYAITIVDAMHYIAEKFKQEVIAFNGDKRTFGDNCSALNKFREFLRTNFSNDYLASEGSSTNDVYRKAINKGLLSKIDGIEGLVAVIGEKAFVKYAVENSFFFDTDIVEERMDEMIELLAEGKALPARRTTKEQENLDMYHQKDGYFFEGEDIKIPIEVSKDGNDLVRSIIKKKTGYSTSEGKNSVMQNYIISHLWGRAFDPRYYTSLWNVVLVPVWANSLLDKQGTPDSFAAQLKATFMHIIMKLYFDRKQKAKLPKLQLNKQKSLPIEAKPFKDNFTIALLGKKGDKAIGAVNKVCVKIK